MDCDVSLFDTTISMLTYPAIWNLNGEFEPKRTTITPSAVVETQADSAAEPLTRATPVFDTTAGGRPIGISRAEGSKGARCR